MRVTTVYDYSNTVVITKCGKGLIPFCNPAFFELVCTVKTFGLLQPYFGHLSCMLVVCVTHYKLQKDASNLNQSLRVIEKLLPQLRSSYRKPIAIWLHILLAFHA